MNNPVCPTCLSDNKVPEWNNMFKDLEMQMNDVVEQVCGIRNKYRRLVSEIRDHLERAEFHAWKKEQRKENTNG